MLVIVVLSLTVLLQLIAVFFALRLIKSVGGRFAWLALALAISLMSIEGVRSLSRVIQGYPAAQLSLNTELVNLSVSLLILLAIISTSTLIKSLKLSEKKLDEEIQRNQLILQTNMDGFVVTSSTGVIREVNEAFVKLINLPEKNLLNKNIDELIIHNEVYPRQDWLEVLSKQDDVRFEARLLQHEHGEIDIDITAKYVHFDHSSFIYIFVRDISLRKATESMLVEQKIQAQVTLESIGDGVITTDMEGNIQYINPVAEKLIDREGMDIAGCKINDVVFLYDENEPDKIVNPVEDCIKNQEHQLLTDHLLFSSDNTLKHAVELVVTPLRNAEEQVIGAVLIIHNVTDLKSLTEVLSYQATHDALTGLINRVEFENRLETAVDNARHSDQQHAMCYIDMDQFKLVNDTCGHAAGDELLKQVTHLLHNVVRETDSLARLGGDEFGILLQSCSLVQARRVVESIFNAVREFRFHWDNRVFEVGMSIGLVAINKNTGDLSDILSSADSACYVAKESGRNCMYIFEPNDRVLMERRGQMEWVQDLRHAMDNDKFELYAQTIKPVNGNAGLLPHLEVLLRMTSDDGKLIMPDEFIPAAERYHMMPGIDRWVVENVFKTLENNPKIRQQIDMMAINLSGQSIGDEEFLSHVLELFEKYDVHGENICFEITETAVISNIVYARNFISTLKNMGCKFALDDFGSGLSSFQYLKDLDVDFLKIDGSFIRSMAYNTNNFNMVTSINHIGHVMGIQTIAEYVETDETRKMLEELGLDYIQGYLVDKPCHINLVVDD